MLARTIALCSTALIALAAFAAPSGALPGDPPVAPLAPEDGQALAVDAEGILVRFSCPAYSAAPATPPFVTPVAGLVSDYGAAMSSASDLGADGRLARTDGIGAVVEVAPGTCEARLGGGGFPKPQLTPGTWYWQTWRACSGCDDGADAAIVSLPRGRQQLRARAASGSQDVTSPPVGVDVGAARRWTTTAPTATRAARRCASG